MKTPMIVAAILAAGIAQAAQPSTPDSLVPIKAKKVDQAFLLPGADFRNYQKVYVKKAEVAFRANWVRDVNSGSAGLLTNKVTQADAERIVKAAREGFDQIWIAAFKSAGYEVVGAPGEGVLQVEPSVEDLYVNAPQASSGGGMSRSYTVEGGEATLHVTLRDGRLGTILGRVVDREETGLRPNRFNWSDSTTNAREFEKLFTNWAVTAVNGITELRAASPLPADMKAGSNPRKK